MIQIAFIEWARHQIEIFAEMFRKQVFGPDVDTRVVEDAIKVTHMQSRKVSSSRLCTTCAVQLIKPAR